MSEPASTEETPQELAPVPPQEEEEETKEPIFDLQSMLRSKKGAQFGTGEVMAYAILADIMDRREDRREERMWKRERRESQQTNPSKSPEVESIKSELSELRKTVTALADIIKTKEQTEAQKAFVNGVVKETTDKIMPDLQAIKDKLAEYDEKIASGQEPTTNLEDIKTALTEAIDRMGEKVGAGGKTLTDVTSDVDKVLSLIETVEKRLKRGEGGEVDYKTMTVSTLGEIGKEMISAYRDVATASREGGSQPPQQETPASAMQTIIKRQVQNYILQRMETGATTMNVQQAAQELALTPGQVAWAYNQLMKEGWFHVRTPQKTKGKMKHVQEPQTGEETETERAEESDQVFEPPPE